MAKEDKKISRVYVKSRVPRVGQMTQTELMIKASPDLRIVADQGGVMVSSGRNANEEHFIPISNIADIVFVKTKDATTSQKTAG